jgi:hypothetical protein
VPPRRRSAGGRCRAIYDWPRQQWTVPINLSVTQLVKLWGQPLSLQLGVRSYAERPQGGPDWGLRFAVTLLFPK